MGTEETIFAEALTKKIADEREAYLHQVCAGSLALFQIIHRALARRAGASCFLQFAVAMSLNLATR